DFHTSLDQVCGNRIAGVNCTALFLKFNGRARPDGPMAEKTADDAARYLLSVHQEYKGGEQIHDDVVVLARIKGCIATGFGDGANDVERVIAIEGSDFDRYDIFDFCKFAPETVGEDAAANGRLQVETNNGNDLRDGARVSEKFGVGRIFESCEA